MSTAIETLYEFVWLAISIYLPESIGTNACCLRLKERYLLTVCRIAAK